MRIIKSGIVWGNTDLLDTLKIFILSNNFLGAKKVLMEAVDVLIFCKESRNQIKEKLLKALPEEELPVLILGLSLYGDNQARDIVRTYTKQYPVAC